jgi:hypothetical protein
MWMISLSDGAIARIVPSSKEPRPKAPTCGLPPEKNSTQALRFRLATGAAGDLERAVGAAAAPRTGRAARDDMPLSTDIEVRA